MRWQSTAEAATKRFGGRGALAEAPASASLTAPVSDVPQSGQPRCAMTGRRRSWCELGPHAKQPDRAAFAELTECG
jgi:hypothetical protein